MDKKEYLVRGALLQCDCGTHPRRLNLPESHGLYVEDHPCIYAKDCTKDNISYFGICNSETPPESDETIVLKGYVPEGSDEEVDDVQGVCCVPEVLARWQDGNKPLQIMNEAEAVTTGSYLVCLRGGIITPATSGQEYEEK